LFTKGWKSKKGDEYFQRQRSSADQADGHVKRIFFNMMRQIGEELHDTTSAFTPQSAKDAGIKVLDICMAPGGFSAAIFKEHQDAKISAITLPKSQNGHDILLPDWKNDRRLEFYFADVTMLAVEMGVSVIPTGHPDAANFLSDRPFSDQKYDLVFCDGQVLRMHPRAEYREKREAWRLLTSQLVVSLQRVKENGTIIVLLHRLDAWDTVALLHTLNRFSSLQLFKPKKKHAVKSSFYVVAKNIQSSGEEIPTAIETWKREWYIATFGTEEEYEENRIQQDDMVRRVLRDFGDELVTLGGSIWKIQSDALRRAPFI
jgi:23S rRNA U2552 (ribose-2'-O)-methylase RlmE/FtsJ